MSGYSSPTQPVFRKENDREFHTFRDGIYMFPCDEQEKDRMDLYHSLFMDLRGGQLHWAPIVPNSQPLRILDLGTGTGIWAIDMAEKFKDAEVIGVDLAPIQPKQTPSNVRFQVCDFESEWALGRDSFDLIHLRMGLGSVSSWPKLWRRALEHLKPGFGWVEYVEIDPHFRSDDGTLRSDSPILDWQRYLEHATSLAGKPYRYEVGTKQIMEEAGFIDVQAQTLVLPINPWPMDARSKNLGKWFQTGLEDGLEAFSMAPFTRMLGWSKAQVLNYLQDVRREIGNRRVHAYCYCYVWIGRRPQ